MFSQENTHSTLYRVTAIHTVGFLTSVSHISHGVLKGPDDGVQHQFELCWGNGEEGWEAVGIHCLQQVEEVCAVLWILLKILDQNKTKHTHTQDSDYEGQNN